MKRRVATLVALAGLAAGAAIVPAAPANAAVVSYGRHCTTYYAQNNPASGWGFEICAKLEYDTSAHRWRANAAIRTRTSGIRNLFVYVGLNILNAPGASDVGSDNGPPPEVSARSTWADCSGRTTFTVYGYGAVVWPNGVSSGDGDVGTNPPTMTLNCG